MGTDWYSIDDLPDGVLGARVYDGRRVFHAARLPHPKTRLLTWCEPPTPSTPLRWRPDLQIISWQPLDAARWRWAPGMDVPTAVPPPDGAQDTLGQWWWCASAVQYEQKGAVTARMAEGRVLRGLVTDGARHLARPRMARSLIPAPPLIEIVGEDETSMWRMPLQTTPGDMSDVDVSMGWFAALYPAHLRPHDWILRRGLARFSVMQVVLLYVAADASPNWTMIGKSRHVCRSGRQCRQLFERTVDCLVRIANGQSVAGRLEI